MTIVIEKDIAYDEGDRLLLGAERTWYRVDPIQDQHSMIQDMIAFDNGDTANWQLECLEERPWGWTIIAWLDDHGKMTLWLDSMGIAGRTYLGIH